MAVRKPDGVALVDLGSGIERARIPLGGSPRQLQLAGPGGPVLGPEGNDRLYRISLPAGTVVSETAVGRQPHDAAAAGGGVFVGDEFADTVTLIAPDGTTRNLPAPAMPGGVAFGVPLADDEQLEAPWSCTACGSHRGFRRRGFRPKPRKVMTACGQVAFRSQQLGCGACGRRFAPAAELLGLRPHQRRTGALSDLAASLAVEVATPRRRGCWPSWRAPACRPAPSAVTSSPWRLSASALRSPTCPCCRSTGRANGPAKPRAAWPCTWPSALWHGGARARRCAWEARLLGATVAEGWSVMGDLLGGLRPGLILVDGEEELSALAAERFPGVPVQRCLWHLARGVYRAARYTDRASHELAEDFRRQLEALLLAAYRGGGLATAQAAYADLIDDAEGCGARAAAGRRGRGVHLPHPPRCRAARLRRQGPARARHRRAGAGHAGDEPAHRRRRALVGSRRAGHPHGQAAAQVRSRPVVTESGG